MYVSYYRFSSSVCIITFDEETSCYFKARKKPFVSTTDRCCFGLSDWQASGRKDEFINEYVKQNDQLLKIEKRVKRWYHIRDSIIQLVVGIVVISMIIWTGNEAASEQIAPTVIATFVLMTLSVTNALIPIADAIDRIPSYVESTHRLNGVESDSVLHDETDLHGEKDYIEPKHVDIELNHVSYSYPDSNEIVLKDVSLQIKAGKKIAILGRSGTGKSTLLKLLTGALSPVNGQVVLNGERANTNLLSKYISVLNQKPHLFDTTIGNNVRIGKPEATDEEIWKALEKAQLASHVTSLPDGLQTKMHEMGKRFSGGERQRVAFARTLMQETPIIVLDEPTIGLDPKQNCL